MDRIAIISDIHGNIPALEAVLHDIRARDVSRILCLGDLVGKGPDGARAIDICREVCAVTVKGNWDEHILRDRDDPTIRWNQARLGPDRMAYLADLPTTIDFVMSGKQVRLFHASHGGIYHRVHMDDTSANHMAMFTNTPFTGDAVVPDVVGYGDIHAAYLKSFDQRLLFNVGSVGNPLDLTQAAYGILEGQYDDTRHSPFSIQLIRVPYDIERAIRDAEQAQMPELQLYIDELRTARYRWASKNAT